MEGAFAEVDIDQCQIAHGEGLRIEKTLRKRSLRGMSGVTISLPVCLSLILRGDGVLSLMGLVHPSEVTAPSSVPGGSPLVFLINWLANVQ